VVVVVGVWGAVVVVVVDDVVGAALQTER